MKFLIAPLLIVVNSVVCHFNHDMLGCQLSANYNQIICIGGVANVTSLNGDGCFDNRTCEVFTLIQFNENVLNPVDQVSIRLHSRQFESQGVRTYLILSNHEVDVHKDLGNVNSLIYLMMTDNETQFLINDGGKILPINVYFEEELESCSKITTSRDLINPITPGALSVSLNCISHIRFPINDSLPARFELDFIKKPIFLYLIRTRRYQTINVIELPTGMTLTNRKVIKFEHNLEGSELVPNPFYIATIFFAVAFVSIVLKAPRSNSTQTRTFVRTYSFLIALYF